MDTQTIARQSRQDKPFQLHVPSFSTMSCVHCGAPIISLETWLETECSAARQLEGAAA